MRSESPPSKLEEMIVNKLSNAFLQAVLVSRRFLATAREEDSEVKDVDEEEVGGSGEEVKVEVVREEKALPIVLTILWVLTNISSSLSFMITIVYWSVLYNPERNELDFENFSGHLLIAVVHFIDVIIGDR